MSGSFCNSRTCNPQGSSKNGSLIIILPVIGAILVAIGIVFAIFVCRKKKRRAIKEASPGQTETKAILTIDSSKTSTTDTQSNFTSSIPSYPSSKSSKDFAKSSYFGAHVFSYEELEVATDNFNGSRELGDGGFGTSIGFESNGSVRRMVTLVAELAFRCVQQEKDMRPTMKEVVETLRGIQNDDMNAQKPEVLDIVVDDGGVLMSPEFGVTNKLVDGTVPNSSDG
ncbi:Concanavalin A-like lectin/glucanase, subgroup [Cynara cardunculus var. scolymus]|uniref:Concanavalin A-like lectin/glucanase, subgroup n=1 Tax=Cynara cardunculus var. scolymus TaxID=59895 RepID=A0A103Y0A2_CYNCS|nr:Concanavalin A-like lectin/glucanase, subgroup [Cynara cardunculus var. scolymus]